MRKHSFLVPVLLLMLALLAAGCGSTDTGYLSVGDQAPDFLLTDMNGTEVSLAGQLGEKPVLLYFSMAEG